MSEIRGTRVQTIFQSINCTYQLLNFIFLIFESDEGFGSQVMWEPMFISAHIHPSQWRIQKLGAINN